MEKIDKMADSIVKNYKVDYVTLHNIQELTKSEYTLITQTTLRNISKWALNGASDTEISKNLEITKDQFQTLCNICPVLVSVMKDSRAMADVIIAGSLVQTAIGGKTIREQQVVTIKEYNEYGKVIGEHKELVWVEKELPPNPLLLKFLAENKLNEKFGNKDKNVDTQVDQIVANADENTLKMLEGIVNEKTTNK